MCQCLHINIYVYFVDSDSASISSNASSTIEKKSRIGGGVAKPKLKVFPGLINWSIIFYCLLNFSFESSSKEEINLNKVRSFCFVSNFFSCKRPRSFQYFNQTGRSIPLNNRKEKENIFLFIKYPNVCWLKPFIYFLLSISCIIIWQFRMLRCRIPWKTCKQHFLEYLAKRNSFNSVLLKLKLNYSIISNMILDLMWYFFLLLIHI